ncbi:MAG: hypothetical protein R3D05_08835 [Dongiaceae bacterium]
MGATPSIPGATTSPARRGTIRSQRCGNAEALAGTPCIVLYVRHEPRLAFTRAATANGGPEGRHGSEEQQPIFFDIHGGRD